MNTAAKILEHKPPATPGRQYTLEEYLEREKRTVHKHEFYNGYLQRMSGAKYQHNLIAANVIRLLGNAVEQLSEVYHVLNSDQKIYIAAENIVLYPDALVICQAPIFWNEREDLILNPLVIVEIASKSTRSYDRGEKFLLYQLIPGLREYVLIEQDKPKMESWFRQDADTWKTAVATGNDATLPIQALGILLDLNAVYRHITFEK